MNAAPVVIQADGPHLAQLQREGWVITARSWAAQLKLEHVHPGHLRALTARAAAAGTIRELSPHDAKAVLDLDLDLDLATAQDYPGGPATTHVPLTPETAVPTARRRGFGVFGPDEALVAMTFVDIEGAAAEIEFTVVSRAARGSGIGTGLKAVSVLNLIDHGVTTFRTGGSSDNDAILRANTTLGFVVDEQWVTLIPPTEEA